MRTDRSATMSAVFLAGMAACHQGGLAGGATPVAVRVHLSRGLARLPASGRLVVLLARQQGGNSEVIPSWTAGVYVDHPVGGQTFTVHPTPSSGRIEAGRYVARAFVDTNQTAAYFMDSDEGDLEGKEATFDLHPSSPQVIDLSIDREVPPRNFAAPASNVHLEELASASLSAFWGRPIVMRAAVVLPPGYEKSGRSFPTVFHVHGFTGDYRWWAARKLGQSARQDMASGKIGEMIMVFLDAHISTGHHVFADSVNNGPWATALVSELIPHLERKYRMVAEAKARFLMGHSSGGWASLWLQINHPDVFGGAWPSAPDPVSFESFLGMNLRQPAGVNAYRLADGQPRGFMRDKGKDIMSFQEIVTFERSFGDYGGQMASFDATFSPRGPDGRPLPLFDRKSGAVDPAVADAWKKYDITLFLEREWETLGPKLHGKLHLFVGEADTFRLNEPMRLLCNFLESRGERTSCAFIPGRTHFTLEDKHERYPDGLAVRMLQEMSASFQKAD